MRDGSPAAGEAGAKRRRMAEGLARGWRGCAVSAVGSADYCGDGDCGLCALLGAGDVDGKCA